MPIWINIFLFDLIQFSKEIGTIFIIFCSHAPAPAAAERAGSNHKLTENQQKVAYYLRVTLLSGWNAEAQTLPIISSSSPPSSYSQCIQSLLSPATLNTNSRPNNYAGNSPFTQHGTTTYASLLDIRIPDNTTSEEICEK